MKKTFFENGIYFEIRVDFGKCHRNITSNGKGTYVIQVTSQNYNKEHTFEINPLYRDIKEEFQWRMEGIEKETREYAKTYQSYWEGEILTELGFS